MPRRSPPDQVTRVVLDSSVVIAAGQPSEAGHDAARAFVDRLRAAHLEHRASAHGPPELWLETHVVERRLERSRRGGGAACRPEKEGTGRAKKRGGPDDDPAPLGLQGLDVELVAPADREELKAFLEHLTLRMRGQPPFSNATDLVYLWAAWSIGALVVTLDEGLLRHHQLVCEVMRPQHVLV